MRLIVTTLFALTFAGCDGRVQVVDSAGKPVQGAQVAPVTLSMNGPAETSDAKGEASVPLRISGQETKWVSVSKAGFKPEQVGVPAKWPLKVVLQSMAGP
jgi:hypothetical protein